MLMRHIRKWTPDAVHITKGSLDRHMARRMALFCIEAFSWFLHQSAFGALR